MSETATVKKEPISRLSKVRSGSVASLPGKMPRRGRIVVDIDAVLPDPANERKAFHNLEGLAESIKATGGIIEPPTVVPHPEEEGKYLLTTGERRWRAAKLAELKQIPVIVGDAEDEQHRRLKSLISNVQREDLGIIELANAIQAMKDERDDINSNRDVVPLIGKSEQWIGSVLKVLSMPADHQKRIINSATPIAYDTAVQIARVKEDDAQLELLEDALGGASVRDIREKASTLKATKGGEEPPQQKRSAALSYTIAQDGISLTARFTKNNLTTREKGRVLKEAYEELRRKVLS
jgi:ParB family chromosome partitioning protein